MRSLESRQPAFRSVGAIISNEAGDLLLQLRDDKASIFFPGMWGLFGGECMEGELEERAVIREVKEEIGIYFEDPQFFINMSIDFPGLGAGIRKRTFYRFFLPNELASSIDLGEGKMYQFFSIDRLPPFQNIAPFDLAAINLYINTKLLSKKIMPS